MPRMPETVAALQRAETVRVARLVQLDFASRTFRLHQGVGPIATQDPDNPGGPLVTWDGIGQVGQISDIDRAVVPSGGGPTLTLSGVDPGLIAVTMASSTEAKGRPARIFDQHYGADWQRLDAPLAIASGLMDRLTIKDDGKTATITLTLLTLLHNRRRPAFGYLNQASQSRLHPGDYGLSEVQSLVQRSLKWPTY